MWSSADYPFLKIREILSVDTRGSIEGCIWQSRLRSTHTRIRAEIWARGTLSLGTMDTGVTSADRLATKKHRANHGLPESQFPQLTLLCTEGLVGDESGNEEDELMVCESRRKWLALVSGSWTATSLYTYNT